MSKKVAGRDLMILAYSLKDCVLEKPEEEKKEYGRSSSEWQGKVMIPFNSGIIIESDTGENFVC